MSRKRTSGFSADERAAMKERARELKKGPGGEADVLAKIAELPEPDRTMALRVHELITAAVPSLTPRTWYGMPAYARDGQVICFFQSGQKFKARYALLGFRDAAHLDDGDIWPTSFALTKLTRAVEARIRALVQQAASDHD